MDFYVHFISDIRIHLELTISTIILFQALQCLQSFKMKTVH